MKQTQTRARIIRARTRERFGTACRTSLEHTRTLADIALPVLPRVGAGRRVRDNRSAAARPPPVLGGSQIPDSKVVIALPACVPAAIMRVLMSAPDSTLRGSEAAPEPVLRDAAGRPLRDLRLSVTDRCNFRCVYCMPKEVFGNDYAFLERKELLTFEEIARLARIFHRLGIQKIRLTGGEPLVRRNIERLIAMLAAIPGLDLTLTTNGSALARKARA